MAMSAYYLKGVQKTNVELLDIFRGIMPFLAIVIFAMFLMYMFPGIALWLPETLFAQ
jgi:TRAP-type mannitol/chloroaromatic compound transport system permease large subunit